MTAVAVTRPQVPGATYRQLDYWAKTGLLQLPEPCPGSGRRREWPAEEVRVATVIARLIRAGLPLAIAHQVARGTTQIAPGVWVLVDSIDRVAGSG